MIKISRNTNETKSDLTLNINGTGKVQIETGIGFFNHMIELLAFWAEWDLKLICKGDLHVDTHHTVEDVGLILGKAFNQEWIKNKSIDRISYSFCPLDEALSRVVVDLCNRPFCSFKANFNVEKVGSFETEMTEHFFRSFAQEARITIHVESICGNNSHHIIETMFKALGVAIKNSLKIRNDKTISSTKGKL